MHVLLDVMSTLKSGHFRRGKGDIEDTSLYGRRRLSSSEMSRCICAYYNDEDVELDEDDGRALSFLKDHNMGDYSELHGVDRLAFVLNAEGSISLKKDRPWSPEAFTLVGPEKAVAEMRGHHKEFRKALRWLCSPKDVPKSGLAISDTLLARILRSGRLGRSPDIDRVSEKYLRYFETHGFSHFRDHLWMPGIPTFIGTSSFRHWIDLFCRYLVHECAGQTPEGMPVKICRHCKRLFSVAEFKEAGRRRKTYCSTECQQHNFWTKERRAEDMFVRRIADKPERYKEPSVQQRLQEIEKHWPAASGIILSIQRIRKRATK
jgi:hypothetical protein